MKEIRKHLENIRKLPRHLAHPLLHKVHKKHKIAKRTLFYIKEYGKDSNALKTILKESFKILLFAAMISCFGGLAIEQIKGVFIAIIPLLILLPTLNDMVGDYATIMSSKFATMLHEGEVTKTKWKTKGLFKLVLQILLVAVVMAIFSSVVALFISIFSDYTLTFDVIWKVIFIAVIDVMALILILFFVSLFAGLHFYKMKEDPNNFLIPLTTSIADFANMFLLFFLVVAFF